MGEVAVSYVSVVPRIADNFGGQLEAQMRKASTGAFGPIDAASKKSGEKSAKTFGESFRSVATPILTVAAVGAIASFVDKSVTAFSALQDATGAAGVVFGDALATIERQADGAASAMGMSKTEAIDAAVTFGTFGKSAGLAGEDLAGFSTKMVQLAGDMASFRGTSPEQAIEAIGSAMRGEAEPIRAYGVLLDDATLRARALSLGLIATTKDALSPQNKVLAAQAEILAQTTDAQGDYLRTADSAANVQKTLAAESADLAAEIGEKLAPAIVSAQKAGIGLIRWATDNQAAIVPLMATMGTLAAAVGGFVLAAKGIEAVKAARATIAGLGDAFQQMGTKAKIATASAGGIGLALAAASVVYGIFAQKHAEAEQAVESYTQSLEAENGALGANVRLVVAKRLEDEGALKAAQTLGIGADLVTSAILGQGDAMARVQALMAARTDEMGEQTGESVRLGEAARILDDALGGESAALASAVEGYKRVAEAAPPATAATKGNTAATNTNSDAQQTNADKLNAVLTARLKLRGDKRALEAAYDDATEAVKRNGRTMDTNTAKGRANQAALDQIASAALAVGGNMDDSRKHFIEVAKKMGLSSEAAQKLATKLGLIKSKKVTVEASVKMNPSADEITYSVAGHGNVKFSARAGGGAVDAGELYRVGERGWEWYVPKVDGFIVNQQQAAAAVSSPRSAAAQAIDYAALASALTAALESRRVSMLTIAEGVSDYQSAAYRRS